MNEQLDQSDAKEEVKAAPTGRPMRPAPRRTSEATAPMPPMPPDDDDDGFFATHRIKIIIGAVVLLGVGGMFFKKPGTDAAPQKAPERIVSIKLPPMPPPPPPPPPKVQPPPPKQEKMVEQAPVQAEEKHESAPKPKAAAPAPLGTGIKGDGPGMSGLGGSGEGGGFGGTGTGGGGSKWGFFASQVQSRVAEALRSNKTTKSANLKVQVRIWSDSTGRITRAKLDGSTGDKNLDEAIQNQVLSGLQLREPPPAGMPMPIVMRLSARRP